MSERIKLYLDEDAQRTDLIQALRARQIDVVTVSEANLLGQSDAFHLQYANRQDRVIFTFNRGDFFRLHTEWLRNGKPHSGIIISDQISTGTVMRRLLRLIDAKSADDMHDWLEFLSNWG
jgi:predicted nuclease of predicted toxin-antitoxin system